MSTIDHGIRRGQPGKSMDRVFFMLSLRRAATPGRNLDDKLAPSLLPMDACRWKKLKPTIKILGAAHGARTQTDHRKRRRYLTPRACEKTACHRLETPSLGPTPATHRPGTRRRQSACMDGRVMTMLPPSMLPAPPLVSKVDEPHEIEGDDPISGEARNEDPGALSVLLIRLPDRIAPTEPRFGIRGGSRGSLGSQRDQRQDHASQNAPRCRKAACQRAVRLPPFSAWSYDAARRENRGQRR